MTEPYSKEATLSNVEWAQWRAFALMSRRLASAVEGRLQREAGISAADFEILDALARADSDHARAKDLAEMLTWEKSRISHQVTRMVDRGLVERSECDEDLRGSWVHLTPTGREALMRALPHHAAAVKELFFSHLSEDHMAVLTQGALSIGAATTTGECRGEVDRLAREATPTAS